MINERDRHISRRILGQIVAFLQRAILRHAAVQRERKTMTSAMAAFGKSRSAYLADCYLLMTRLQNRSANRGSSGHSCGPDGGNDTGGGWSISSWFGGDNSASDGSGNPSEAGGGDGGGCADGGGGGD